MATQLDSAVAGREELLKNLSIRQPESTNPIHFSAFVAMDYDIAEILRRNLSNRELQAGLPPEARRLEEWFAKLLEEAQDQTVPPVRFQANWEVYDPPGRRSRWLYGPGGIVLQKYATGTDDLGMVAIHNERLTEDARSIVLNMYMGQKNEAGLVFNFADENDYWVFRYRHWADATFPHVVSLLHFRDQKATRVNETEAPLPDFTGKDIGLEVVTKGTALVCSVTDGTTTYELPLPEGPKLAKGLGVGLYTRHCADAQFTALDVTYPTSTVRIVPWVQPEGESQEYERTYSMHVIDMRPRLWLRRMQRLWAERLFARNRARQAQSRYQKVMEADASPEEIDNVEGFFRRAFEKKLRADELYDEFRSFLRTEDIDIPDERGLEADLLGDYKISLTKQIERMRVETWKEFYVQYLAYFDDEGEYQATPVPRRFKFQHINKVRHTTFLNTRLGAYNVYDFEERLKLRHDPNVNVGTIVSWVEAKWWETRHRVVAETAQTTIDYSGSIFDALKDALQRDLAEAGEGDDGALSALNMALRQYRFVNGEYVDQHGVSLYEHVIDITENPKPDVEDVLIVPVVEGDGAAGEYSKLVVMRNPVFSGRQIHPPSFLFEQRFMLDVAWSGIGLGEFSHSVNLFPGEERELQIVSTKKRSWETVSKTTEISKAGATSETATATKRNDSFQSSLKDSFQSSSKFDSSASSTSEASRSSSVSAKVGFGGLFGMFSASVGAKSGSASKSTASSSSSSSLSTTSNKVRDMASKTSSEVSNNNKVSFTSSTETQKNLEEKVTAEDSESETTKISISNINEGKTINYNFFQVTNIYGTSLRIEDVKLHISTGIEIIAGTGLTIDKTYDIEDFANIMRDFRVYSLEDRRELMKAVAAQILRRYVFIGGVDSEDHVEEDPQIVRIRAEDTDRLTQLRELAQNIVFDESQFVPPAPDAGAEGEAAEQPAAQYDPAQFHQPFPEELAELAEAKLYVRPLKVGETDFYTINSGKYYVDAQVGLMPATEEYLESRREIETGRQQAIVEELKARTKAGVFFQDLPEGVTQLSIDQQPDTTHDAATSTDGGSPRVTN